MTEHLDIFLGLISLSLFLILESLWRRNDRKKIYAYIDQKGGEVNSIQNIAMKQHVYSVEYTLNDEKMSKTVKFTILQEEIWY